MKQFIKIKTFAFVLLLALSLSSFAQNDDQDDEPTKPLRKRKFLVGMYLGSYFANKYSASTYNGYGFDYYGQKNSFLNSFMNQKINEQYGGKYGQPDQIAAALGVDPGQWTFNESDMPQNMHYTPSIVVGFNFRHALDKKTAILLNFNGCKLNLQGNFTMTLLRPSGTNPAINSNIQTFGIKGGEQRLLFQLGFQRLLGDDDKLNFFVETGFNGTLAKFDKNLIMINNLQIDLTNYYNQTLYAAPGQFRRPIGFGVGAFAGFGLNVDINPKFLIQLLYSPTYEKINIGTNPTLKLQNSIGFRAYYKV
ncbi:MAG: hypothetical protein H0U95_10125 [Bacteroidetes bacterium]|nr:hypothetical protein [Bacteroidota bacterium]